MSAIKITCPETGIEVPVGIETDAASFSHLPNIESAIRCPACGKEHAWSVSRARLEERTEAQPAASPPAQ